MDLTERQQWQVMRSLVGENNNLMRSMFSGAVAADVNSLDNYATANGRPLSEKYKEFLKTDRISTGIRDIYKACADRFFENDYNGSVRYLELQDAKKNWIDQLSTVDLFHLYVLQTRVIKQFSKVDDLNATSAVDIISKTPLSKYFSGKVEFSGKPARTIDDKTKIDVEDVDLRVQVLHDIALDQHKNYCAINNLDPEQKEEKVMTLNGLGRYSGLVASRYLRQREFAEQQQKEDDQFIGDQMVFGSATPEIVGFDDQYSPLYKYSDGSYRTSTGESYSGSIYEHEGDVFVLVGNTEEGELVGPTDESDLDVDEQLIGQTSLFKRDVAPNSQTEGSDLNQ
ncbi:MAG: hypothetical protein IJD48_02540 [Clostridia bacterium]|nr:hypothetical protein [Clostridia bacterium]